MSWRVISSVICPNTGIVYSSILGLKFLKLIIWYESDVYLYPGDRIYPTKNGVFINGVFKPISIYNISPYNEMLWSEIKTRWHAHTTETSKKRYAHTRCIATRGNARMGLPRIH